VAGLLGLVLPTFPQLGPRLPTASELSDTCRLAEAAGAQALWSCDHLFWHTPAVECLSSVAVSIAATKSATVGPCVLQLPLRNASAVAKQAASLNHLSDGRLVLGIGIGNHRGEYEAAGADYATRGQRLDEGIEELRSAWSSARDDQRYRQLPDAGPIPVWVGGSSEAALRRAAHRADGWIPLFVPADEYAPAVDRLEKEAERVGRDPEAITRALVVFVSVGGPEAADRGLAWMSSLYSIAPEAFRRHLVAGDAHDVASALSRFSEAGAQHLAVFVTADDPIAQFEDLAGELAGMR